VVNLTLVLQRNDRANLCIKSVARSFSDMLTIGRIAYRWEGVTRSAQRGRSVIYDCFVIVFCCTAISCVAACFSVIRTNYEAAIARYAWDSKP